MMKCVNCHGTFVRAEAYGGPITCPLCGKDATSTAKDEPMCCVCHHPLANHLKETKWFRCHSLGADFYQCECRLHDFGEGIEEYNYQKRVEDQLRELRAIKA